MTQTATQTLPVPPGPLARFDAAATIEDGDLDQLRTIAVVGIVILNLLDLLITRHVLALGLGQEANPLMAPLVESSWGVLVKAALPILIGLRHLRAPIRRPLVLALCWVCVVYLGVVTWNYHLVTQAGLL